jgi:hypothetical protein
MAKARASRLRAIVVLIAGLLAVAVLWAGSALGGGSGGGTTPSTPAKSDASIQSGERGTHKNCPREHARNNSSTNLDL